MQVAKPSIPRIEPAPPAFMPAESAILTHAQDLAPLLVERVLSGDGTVSGMSRVAEPDQPRLYRCFRVAEAAALNSVCEESLWNDYGLLPALRDDFQGKELAEGSKVLRPDGAVIRGIRDRVSAESAILRKADEHNDPHLPNSGSLLSTSIQGVDFQSAAAQKYLEALTQWTAPATLPGHFKKRVLDTWYQRFGAAFRSELRRHDGFRAAADGIDSAADDRRFDELNRQSWRLDEVLGKLDKWTQANQGNFQGATDSGGKFSAQKKGWVRALLVLAGIGLLATAVWGVALWVALGSSPSVESLIAKIQSRRLDGLSERIARAAAWMDDKPVPRNVFTTAISALQDAKDVTDPLTPAQVDAALLDLQQKHLCRSVADGWTFHEQVRKGRQSADEAGTDWWLRTLELLNSAAPADGESAESVHQWRLLLPHFAALFENVPAKLSDGPEMQRLLSALSKGLLASRIEPGQRPIRSTASQESDALQVRLSLFSDAAAAYFEKGLKDLETKYGKFSDEMVTAHRLLAELSWRKRQLKQEQDFWIRVIRALEKHEPRDVRAIVFCQVRLGISRAIASNNEGAEDAFSDALKLTREQQGEAHPEVGRIERKIARVYADLGQFDLAWQHHQHAIESLMKAYPVPTPEIAELHEEQGEFLIDYRNFAQGIAVLERGLDVWRKIEPATSPNIAQAQGGLANAQMLAGDMVQAERLARSRRDLLQQELGASTEMVRDAETDLAAILLTAPDPLKAAEVGAFLKPRLLIPRDAAFADDPKTALTRCLYARALAQSNQIPEALMHFDRGIPVLLNTQSRPSLLVAGCLRDFGQSLLGTDRRLDGLKVLDDAEAELSALSRLRPRYLRISTAQIDDLRERIRRARR